MMGDKRLSTIKEELREAFAKEGYNPIASLDRKIRKLSKGSKTAKQDSRALHLLRGAIAQVIDDKTAQRIQTSRTKRTKKAV